MRWKRDGIITKKQINQLDTNYKNLIHIEIYSRHKTNLITLISIFPFKKASDLFPSESDFHKIPSSSAMAWKSAKH